MSLKKHYLQEAVPNLQTSNKNDENEGEELLPFLLSVEIQRIGSFLNALLLSILKRQDDIFKRYLHSVFVVS